MTRYLLFAGDSYYPSGGWEDYQQAFEELEPAVNGGRQSQSDWWEVVDLNSLEVVWHSKTDEAIEMASERAAKQCIAGVSRNGERCQCSRQSVSNRRCKQHQSAHRFPAFKQESERGA